MAGFTTPAGAGVTKHTLLTDREVAGIIDHASDSVTLAKLLNGMFTADAAGRARFAAGFVNTALLDSDSVILDKVLDNIDLSTINVAALARILRAVLPAAGVANRVQFDQLNRLAGDTGAAWEYRYAPDLPAPMGVPKYDWLLANMAPDSFGLLARFTQAPYTHYLPMVGERAIFKLEALLADRHLELADEKTVRRFVEDLRALLGESPLTERRAFIRSFVKEVKVAGDRAVLTYTMPMPPKGLAEEGVPVPRIVQYGGR